jgi:Family of unknown function (DUF6058)
MPTASHADGSAPTEALRSDHPRMLSGEYVVCLRSVTPEAIVRKGELIDRIEALLARGEPSAELAAAVDELDALLRPFAPYDRIRFGGPESRDRYVTALRQRFSW